MKEKNISFVYFKKWLTEYIVSLNGELPQYEDWKVIKAKLDSVTTYDEPKMKWNVDPYDNDYKDNIWKTLYECNLKDSYYDKQKLVKKHSKDAPYLIEPKNLT